MAAVLEGVRVIEMGDWIAGPYAGTLLADFGAEVVKVEPPGRTGATRTMGGNDPSEPDRSAFFMVFARNKKAVTIDVTRAEGRELFLDLVRRSDVVVESFTPGRLESWQLGWDVLEAANPRLVLLRISGFGQQGPWSARPGFDRVAQAFSGLTYTTGFPDRPPVKAGLGVADWGTGLLGAFGVLLALFERERSGHGQVIDVPLYAALLPALSRIPVEFRLHGAVWGREGNRHREVVPGNTYETADGRWLQLVAAAPGSFERLCDAMGRPELKTDVRYASPAARKEHGDELDGIVAGWVKSQPAADAEAALATARVACTPVLSIADLLNHPHVQARGDFTEVETGAYGAIPVASPGPRLSRTPGVIRRPGPKLGEHNAEILGRLLGVSEARLAELRQAGVV